MNENQQGEKGLFELLEERCSNLMVKSHPSKEVREQHASYEDEHAQAQYEFLVQDMFLDHFFP